VQEEYDADCVCEDGWDGIVRGGRASQEFVQPRETVHGSVGREVLVVVRVGEQHEWQGNKTASLASEREEVTAVTQRFFVFHSTRRLPPRRKPLLACCCVGFKLANFIHKMCQTV
jgi:hypothetical protein